MKIRRINSGEIFYYHTNHLGSTAFVTEQSQNVVQGFLYAPFGEIITEYNANFGSSMIPKYSFNAKELDEETGMYYYEARYYKPPTFTSRDPLFEKYFWISPYAYCANNPIKYVDPDGRKIVITGEQADAAFSEMSNKSKNLKFTKDDNGVISVTGKAKTRQERYMKKIIEDENITVNINASNNTKTSSGANYKIGAFMGNSIDYDKEGNVKHVNAYQEYNVKEGSFISNQVNSEGVFIWHEIAEGYEGGKISARWKQSAEPAFENRSNHIYDLAHNKANKYFCGDYTRAIYDFSRIKNSIEHVMKIKIPSQITIYKLGLP